MSKEKHDCINYKIHLRKFEINKVSFHIMSFRFLFLKIAIYDTDEMKMTEKINER